MLAGCSFPLLNGYRHAEACIDFVPGSWFGSDSGHFLMNTRIDIRGKHFTGLMVIKPQGPDQYRTVFITEIGLKVLDMEFTPGQGVRIHYAMDALNKKAFISMLVHDLRLVLMTGSDDGILLRDRDTGDLVLEIAGQGRRYYYHFPSGRDRASEAVQSRCMLKKARASFHGTSANGIDSVKINHYHNNLRIQMFRIRQNPGHAVE
jgi:hypothetical protein